LFERVLRAAHCNTVTGVHARHWPLALLDHVRQLVRQRATRVAAGAEHDFVANGVGLRRDRSGRRRGFGIAMDTNLGKVVTEASLHLGAHTRRQGAPLALAYHAQHRRRVSILRLRPTLEKGGHGGIAGRALQRDD